MTEIQITIDSAAVDALLQHIANKADHLQPALEGIGHTLNQRIRMTFRDLKTPDGVAWKPLSPVTISRRKNRSSVPLNDTGVLRNSIAYQLSGQSVEIGTNAPQAATMNFGAKQGQFGKNKRNAPLPWGDIPARQFMPTEHLPADWEQEVIDVVEDYLDIV
jgi:phage gpG-like protein